MPSQFIILDRKHVPKDQRVQAPSYEDALVFEHQGYKGEMIFRLESPDELDKTEAEKLKKLHVALYHILFDSLRLTQEQGFDYLDQLSQTLETHQEMMYQVARELDNRRSVGSPSVMPPHDFP